MSRYKPYPKYKPSGLDWLDQVPEHWKQRKVAWDMEMTIGWTPPTGQTKYYGGTHNWITIADLSAGSVSNTKTKITDEAVKDAGAVPADPGSLLFSYKLSVGEVALLAEPAYTNEAIAAFKPSPAVDMRWWKYAAPVILPKAGRENMYGALLLNQELMNGCRFDAPGLDEQVEIAKALAKETARIDALILKKTRFIELLKEKRLALITRAVTKGLDPNVKIKDSGVEWIGKVPSHWSVARVKHVSQLESGHTPDKMNPDFWIDCKIPWVSLKDTDALRSADYIADTDTYINEAGLAGSSARMLPAETVVFTRDATVGLCAITTRPMAVSQHIIGWVPTGKMAPEYLLYVFEAMMVWLDSLTMGATIKTIGMDDIGVLSTPFPSMDEQLKIADAVRVAKSRISKLLDRTQKSINLLKERRSALITAAVTGQIDLRGAA